MWREILVKRLVRPFIGTTSGASTISMVMISGLVLVIAAGTISIMDKRKTYLEMVRMNSQSVMIEKRLENAARSMLAMEVSARAAGQNSDLFRCIVQRNCRDSDTFQPFALHNPARENLTGLRTLSGQTCDGECPIRVETAYSISCGGGSPTCTDPGEIITRYRIISASQQYFGGRAFDHRQGEFSLSTFVCDPDHYVTGINSEGVLSCDRAIASRFAARCEEGSAAYGMSADGLLKCVPVTDFCSRPLAFTYVLDTSGSMNGGGRLNAARNSAIAFVGGLRTGDRGSLTTFSSAAQLRAPLTTNFAQLQSTIRAQRASGLTNMSSGLETGANSLAASGPNAAKVMVFLSDGHHNRGDADPVQVARTVKDQGVRIYSVGFGDSPDRNRLMQIASSPADYFDVVNAGNLGQTFRELSQRLCRGT